MTARQAHVISGRALPVPDESVPTLRLPRDRCLVPRSCGHCGAGLLDLDESRGETAPARIYCVICSRDACWLLREKVR